MSWVSEGLKKAQKVKGADVVKTLANPLGNKDIAKALTGKDAFSIREFSGAAGKQRAEERARAEQEAKIAEEEASLAEKNAALGTAGREALSKAGTDYLSGIDQTLSEADKRAMSAADTVMTANVDPEFRVYQQKLAEQLAAQARGEGPSLAQAQLQQATDRTMAQSLGSIKAGMGSQGALSARTAALAGSNQLANLGGQSGMLRLQEQRAAQDALASVAQQGRGQDIQGTQLSLNAQQAQAQARQAGIDAMIRSGALKVDAQGRIYGTQIGQAQTDIAQSSNQEYAAALRKMGRSEAEIAQAVRARNEADTYSRGIGEKVFGAALDLGSAYAGSKLGAPASSPPEK